MFYDGLMTAIKDGYLITPEDAIKLAQDEKHLPELLYAADQIRKRFLGNQVTLCAIINARSGACSEDCQFCAQSVYYNTGLESHPLLSRDDLIAGAVTAIEMKASRYSIVTSGRQLQTEADLATICTVIKQIGETLPLFPCASLGTLTPTIAQALKQAGLRCYHHNLETAADFFPHICTTHQYELRVNTIKLAQQWGFETCVGGIFGMGENWSQRIAMAFTLRELNVDCIPLNFLIPIKGTPLAQRASLPPLEILRIIALFRFILPGKDIKVCGGREAQLRDLQSWIFYAGASGMMIGNYLTTRGRMPADDLQLIADLQLSSRVGSAHQFS